MKRSKNIKCILSLLILMAFSISFAQKDDTRIQKIRNELTALSVSNSGLTEVFKTEIEGTNLTLSNLLLAVADIHKLNISPSNELNTKTISPSFPNVVVTDLLVFLCKEYELTIDFTGNIMSVKKYIKPLETPETYQTDIKYNPSNNSISIDVKDTKLYDVFKRIMNDTGKNLVFSPGLENKTLTAYIKQTPFDVAMNTLAFANNLYVEQSKDGFFVFEDDTQTTAASNTNNPNAQRQRPTRRGNSNASFKVKDAQQQLLEVDFVNTPIADIINDIGTELNINVFTATSLNNAGVATFKTKSINFDDLLVKIFEAQASSVVSNNPNGNPNQNLGNPTNNPAIQNSAIFTFKKEGNTYFFGTEKQLSVRKVEIIQMQYRSVELLGDPTPSNSNSNNFNNQGSFNTYSNNGFGNTGSQNQNQNQNGNTFNNNNNRRTRSQTTQQQAGNSESQSLLDIIPAEVKADLDFQTDYELNRFYVTGPSAKIERFKTFIKQIDKPVPVVLIEVMIIEVSRTATTETGVEWGIGSEPAMTQGSVFPSTDITLGASTVNKIIGGFNDFGGFNLGKVVPNFFAKIKAMETNGNFKILSTPKLATLNGHRASFSNGQTTYYGVTQRDIFGADNPQTSEITNYFPVQAELGLTIKPSVSGDGQMLLDISVIQSSFGSRVAEDAPPDINSRTFTSIIRMQDQDIAILGGLEETVKNNSGSGVPFLARIPIIKYLFSKRVREAKKSKLSVLIRPTVIY